MQGNRQSAVGGWIAFGAAAAVVLSAGGKALGCVVPPEPPPKSWWVNTGPGQASLYIELGGVFSTSSPHNCSCALGLGSVENPLPFGLDVKAVDVGIVTRANQGFVSYESLGIFSGALLPDDNSTDGWQNGPGFNEPFIGLPNPGAQFFGQGGLVPPVSPPGLLPNQFFVLCFDINFDRSVFRGQLFQAQIGAGLGNEDFSPLFDPENDHTARYSEIFYVKVPTPGTAGVMAISGLCVLRRRRRG